MKKLWFAVIACCGCASPSVDVFPDTSTSSTATTTTATAEPPAYASGARLRARIYVGEDGSQAHVGFFDAERQENCAFSKASDGVLRCLPTAGYSSTYFSDAQCTAPVLAVSCGQVPPAYALVNGGASTCPTWNVPVRALGAVHAGPVYWVYGGTCSAVPATPDVTYYALGPEIAPTEFVAAIEQVE
ncbi:MAG: hypothetical protein HY908_32645 [Myxococcales bacterium]|nr:hypothetical protein [Myxococcales bacterium]